LEDGRKEKGGGIPPKHPQKKKKEKKGTKKKPPKKEEEKERDSRSGNLQSHSFFFPSKEDRASSPNISPLSSSLKRNKGEGGF